MMVCSRIEYIKYDLIIRKNKLTVKIPQMCAKMRIVAEKMTNKKTHLSSK